MSQAAERKGKNDRNRKVAVTELPGTNLETPYPAFGGWRILMSITPIYKGNRASGPPMSAVTQAFLRFDPEYVRESSNFIGTADATAAFPVRSSIIGPLFQLTITQDHETGSNGLRRMAGDGGIGTAGAHAGRK